MKKLPGYKCKFDYGNILSKIRNKPAVHYDKCFLDLLQGCKIA